MVKLSIIIPIYNVEKFVLECLESIFSQLSNKYVEIILVNDGSIDNSMKIVDSYLKEQSLDVIKKVKIINQENRGLSGARNSGIKIAQGDFLYFLDSDDYIATDFFDKILPILDDSIDIIEFNAKFFHLTHANKIFSDRKNIYKHGLHTINSEDMRAEFYGWQDWAVWYRIYNKKIWNNRVFPEGKLYEDAATIPFVYQGAKKIYSLDFTLIYYRNNPNSIMNNKNTKSLDSIDFIVKIFSSDCQTKYIRIVHNRFVIASIAILLKNIGILKTYFWMLKNFKKLDSEILKNIKSKKLVFINNWPLLLIPYFKLKSKGVIK